MIFAGNCLALAIIAALSVRARPIGMHFNVEYRTVGRADRLFNWQDGPFVRTGPSFSGGLRPAEVPPLVTRLNENTIATHCKGAGRVRRGHGCAPRRRYRRAPQRSRLL